MKLFRLFPLLAGVLLFAGCEATIVDRGSSRRGYGYVERDYDYDRGYHRPYYRAHTDHYYADPGYYGTTTTYRSRSPAPYQTYSGDSYRSRGRTTVIAAQTGVSRTVVVQQESKKKKKKKKHHDHDHH